MRVCVWETGQRCCGTRSAPGSNNNQRRTRRNRAKTHTAGLSRPKTLRSTVAQSHTRLSHCSHTHPTTHTHTHTGTTHHRDPTHILGDCCTEEEATPSYTHPTQQPQLSCMGKTHIHTCTHTRTRCTYRHHNPHSPSTPDRNTEPHPNPKVPCCCVSGCCTLLGGVRWAHMPPSMPRQPRKGGQQCTQHMRSAAT